MLRLELLLHAGDAVCADKPGFSLDIRSVSGIIEVKAFTCARAEEE